MAIIGKFWSAVLYRIQHLAYPLTPVTVLAYTDGQQTLDDIAAYYPALAWDVANEVSPTELHDRFLIQYTPAPPYDGGEATMLSDQSYYEGDGADFSTIEGNIVVRFVDGAWSTTEGSGRPSYVRSFFPLANTYNILTPTPFGPYGNGLIRHQALYGPISDADPGSSFGFSFSIIDRTYIWTPVRGSSGTDDEPPPVGEDGGGDGVTDDDVRLRCWSYSLDGHDFYVIRLGASQTLVYDLTTNTWSEWASPGRTNWRAHVGTNWLGLQNAALGLGTSDVVAGDDKTGVLWLLDPLAGRDDRTTTGSDYIKRVVTGGIQVAGRTAIPCNAVELDLALGAPTQLGATITLRTSDDLGHSWVNHGSVTAMVAAYNQVVEWRSLGLMRQPGRIFEISDDGATVRISRATMR